MKYAQQLANLETFIVNHIVVAIQRQGEESKHSSTRVIKITNDDLMFNLSGGRYLTEISENNLIDNSGYTYDYNAITLEQLAEIADSLTV